MKQLGVRAILNIVLLVGLFPASLSAISVYDVVRLSQGKYSDAEIIRIIQATDSRFLLAADDTTRLKKEGVSEPVIREMLSRPAREKANGPAAKTSAKSARASASRKSLMKEAQVEPPPPTPDPATILDEIVRLSKAGLSDETVLAYAKAHRADLPSVVSADHLRRLRESGVSERVVTYLTAIDVRASNDNAEEGAEEEDTSYYGSGDNEGSSGSTYSYPAENYDNSGAYDASYYGDGSYGDGSYAAYPETDYSSYYGGYPFYGEIFYAYPANFFVNRGDFFRRFHHRRDFRDHRRSIGHRRGFDRPRFPRPGQGWRDRPIRARDNFARVPRQSRMPILGRGMPPRPAMVPRAFSQFSGPPRGPFVGRGVPARPTFSGSRPPAPSIARVPIARPAGPPSVGRPGPVIRR